MRASALVAAVAMMAGTPLEDPWFEPQGKPKPNLIDLHIQMQHAEIAVERARTPGSRRKAQRKLDAILRAMRVR